MKTFNKINVSQFIEREFSAIPLHIIERGHTFGENIEEITPTVFYVGEQVLNTGNWQSGEIIKLREDAAIVQVEDQDEQEEWEFSEMEKEYTDYGYPMWGTLWLAGTSWMERFILENLNKIAERGFRIYETEEGDILLGIDGAGYDFYEMHWNPLYELIYA